MYVKIKLLNGWQEPLIYSVPATWKTDTLLNSVIRVPLRSRIEYAWVEEIITEPLTVSYVIKNAHEQIITPRDSSFHVFIRRLSKYYALNPLFFYKRTEGFLKLDPSEEYDTLYTNNYGDYRNEQEQNIVLTGEQSQAVNIITEGITRTSNNNGNSNTTQDTSEVFVLHGITGSGKTEVYYASIVATLAQQKSVLFLLPEVSLALQFTHIFKKRLENKISVFGFHSATSAQEKKSLWAHLCQEKPAIIVGVHLPTFLPIPNLGLIIVDEEHDSGYQEKKHPKINSKEAALLRAQCAGIPVILGSATPSITTLYTAHKKQWKIVTLSQRFSGKLPALTVVSLKDKDSAHNQPNNRHKKRSFWITPALEEALKNQLNSGKQTILFLNRRGYSFFVRCLACNYIPRCAACSVSLTYHDYNHEQINILNKTELLRCHYCNYQQEMISVCPSCSSPKLLKKGIGTQQLVSLVQHLFPLARIARADLDTTVNRKKWQALMHDFLQGKYDILVGTQTITKGYHFPKVTLVGVVWADLHLSYPSYNASETTLQQLLQVAGRAGRENQESQVIIQTMLDQDIFTYLDEQKYGLFYQYELSKREEIGYPPFVRFAEIEVRNTNEQQVEQDSSILVKKLQELSKLGIQPVRILGPSVPIVHKIKNIYSRKIYLKSQSIEQIITLYNQLSLPETSTSSFFFTPNPLSL